MAREDVSYETWLDESFGRAVSAEWHPRFEHGDDWPEPVSDRLALHYLTRLFEHSEESLRYYSDRQIAAGLWELGPGDAHCLYDQDLPIEDREQLIDSVACFFRDFFDKRCVPKLAHLDREYTEPLNGICYMWWEVITWGWGSGDPYAERLKEKDLDVMERVLALPNPACQESALHGLGHMARRSDRALAIIDGFLDRMTDASAELRQYALAARAGCIQ